MELKQERLLFHLHFNTGHVKMWWIDKRDTGIIQSHSAAGGKDTQIAGAT